MKEIRKIKMVEIEEVKFIADDGKEFVGENAEHECKVYERQHNENKVRELFERLDTKQISIPFINWYCEEAEIWKIILNSKQDYYTMTDYFKVVRGCCDDYTEAPKEYPYTMIIVKGWECLDEYNINLKEELQKIIEQLD